MMENMGCTPSLSKLEEDLGYHFQDQKLLLHALTHPSYSNEMGHPKEASNQRLEFLGDAVLELVSSTLLYHKKPVIQEGRMTKLRAALVCESALAVVAKSLQLSSYLLLGKGEEREGIQFRDSVLSDALVPFILTAVWKRRKALFGKRFYPILSIKLSSRMLKPCCRNIVRPNVILWSMIY